MVNFLIKLPKTTWNKLKDRIWPWPDGKSKEPSPEVFQVPGNQELLSTVLQFLIPRQQEVEDRNAAVERKLSSLLPIIPALVSILAIALAAIIARHASTQTNPPEWHFAVLVIATYVAVSYIIIQLTCCTIATIKGLERRTYERSEPKTITPLEGEDETQYKKRQISSLLKQISYNEEIINDRVTWLAVAHCCLKNAAVATLLLIASALPTIIYQAKTIFHLF